MTTVINPLTSLLARVRAAQRHSVTQPAGRDATPRSQQPAPVQIPFDRSRRRWLGLTEELESHARLGNWRSYRDTRLRMAHFLQQKGHLAQALELYLDVWYLDLNGPRDVHSPTRKRRGASLLTEDPLFEPGRAQVPPGIKREVHRLVTSLALRAETVQTIFLHVATVTHRTCTLPLLPTQAWFVIGAEIMR